MKGHWVIAIYEPSKRKMRPPPVLYFAGRTNVLDHEKAVRFADMDSANAIIDLVHGLKHFKGSKLVAEEKELH